MQEIFITNYRDKIDFMLFLIFFGIIGILIVWYIVCYIVFSIRLAILKAKEDKAKEDLK